ncbi:unnamed protein product, partial [Cyprideis torosa]
MASHGSKGDLALSLLRTIPSDVSPNRKNNGGSPVQPPPIALDSSRPKTSGTSSWEMTTNDDGDGEMEGDNKE